MNIKYGTVTMYMINEVEGNTFIVLDSNVGLMFIEIDNDKAASMVELTVKKLGAALGNFKIDDGKVIKTSEYIVPDFVTITDEENEKLKALSEELKEFDEYEYRGIEVHGEAGWMLPADEQRYLKRNYTLEDEYDCAIYIAVDVANNRVRWQMETEGDTLYGDWFDIKENVAEFKVEFSDLLEEPLDFMESAYEDDRVISLFDADEE